MTAGDIEDRLRGAAWPMPSLHLRERVLADAASRAADAADRWPAKWTPPTEPSGPRRLVWRLAPILGVIAALIVIGSCTGLDLWAWRKLDVEIARLEAKYGSLDEATVQAPAVPDVDNRARVIRAAAALAVPLPGKQFESYHYLPLPVPSPVPAELRAFADANRGAIRAMWDIRTRRQANWEVSYPDWSNNPPWNSIRVVSDALYVTALIDLEAGRADDAAQMIVSGLSISASIRQEPQLAQMIWVADWPLRLLRQLVTTSSQSAAALDDLAWWLTENRKLETTRLYMLGGMRMGNSVLMRMEDGEIDPDTASYIYPMTWPAWPRVFLGPAARIGRPFVRTARLRYLRHMDRMLDLQAGPRPRPTVEEPEPPKRWALVDRLVDKFTAGTWEISDRSDDFESQLAVSEIGVALRRFKLDQGAYPESLSALTPTYLDHLPIDPYTGQPPVYARQGAGFTLLGRGSNRDAVWWLAVEWTVLQ